MGVVAEDYASQIGAVSVVLLGVNEALAIFSAVLIQNIKLPPTIKFVAGSIMLWGYFASGGTCTSQNRGPYEKIILCRNIEAKFQDTSVEVEANK